MTAVTNAKISGRFFDAGAAVFNIMSKHYSGGAIPGTNSTPMIDEAFADAKAVGGKVLVPSTVEGFIYDGELDLGDGRVGLVGEQSSTYAANEDSIAASKIIHADGVSGPIVKANNFRAITIEDLLLVGGDSTTWLLSMTGGEDLIEINRLFGRTKAAATNGFLLSDIHEMIAQSIRVHAAAASTGIGVDVPAPAGGQAVNQNIFKNINSYKFGTGMRIGNVPGTGGNVTNATSIIGGQASLCAGAGLIIGDGVRQADVLGWHGESCQGPGLLIGGTAKNTQLFGIHMHDCGLDGVSPNIQIGDANESVGVVHGRGIFLQECDRGILIYTAGSMGDIDIDLIRALAKSSPSEYVVSFVGTVNNPRKFYVGGQIQTSGTFTDIVKDNSNNRRQRTWYKKQNVLSPTTGIGVIANDAMQDTPATLITAHTPDSGFGSWVEINSASGLEPEIDTSIVHAGGTSLVLKNTNKRAYRSANDIANDNFTIYADLGRFTYTNTHAFTAIAKLNNASQEGLYILCRAISTTQCDLEMVVRNGAGADISSSILIATIDFPEEDVLRVGFDIQQTNGDTEVTAWTEPVYGGVRTEVGTSTIVYDNVDASHLRVGIGGEGISNVNYFEVQNFTVVGASGASYTPNCSRSLVFRINANDTSPFTLENPTFLDEGLEMYIAIRNNSGSTMGDVTFGSEYKLDGAFVKPANGFIRWHKFTRTSATVVRESGRAAADQPS
jgi:hypothetical protein